jgi:5-methylcytosine-specific restriction endonuclease McrA
MPPNSYIKKSDKEQVLLIKNCAYCGSEKDLVIEHIHPPSRGGSSELSNLTRGCVSCNSRKNTMLIPEFEENLLVKLKELQDKVEHYKKIISSIQSQSYKIFN